MVSLKPSDRSYDTKSHDTIPGFRERIQKWILPLSAVW